MDKNKISEKTVRNAVERIKRRKNIRGPRDISITMISKEVSCSRNTLYDKRFNKILDPYKRIKKSNYTSSKFTYGSKDYYKDLLSKRDNKIEQLQNTINQIKDKIIDYQILIDTIDILENRNEELKEKLYNNNHHDEIEFLKSENKKLREKVLKAGLTNRNQLS